MALRWNTIKEAATRFSKEWANTSNEESDTKPFLLSFLMYLALAVSAFRPLNTELKNWTTKTGTLTYSGNELF